MRFCQYTITAPEVARYAADHLQRYVRLADHGRKCTAAVLWAVLLWAASRTRSLAAACADLVRAPSDQAARTALLATLPDQAGLQRRLNGALRGNLPKALRRRPQPVAVDLTLLPYYGRPNDHVSKGPSKAGTKQFYAYATAYVIFRGCRWTLALRWAHHSDPWQDIVRDLLHAVRAAGLKVRYLLLDRGFYSVAVVRYLQQARCPFVMPMIRRGRKPDHPEGASGTRALYARTQAGWDRYTLEDKQGQRATVTVAICRVRERRGRGRRDRRRGRLVTWVYALWGLRPRRLDGVRSSYRQRFGIESSYRQMNQARIPTCNRSPLLRLLYVGVALVLRNVYAWLHWVALADRRRGRRRVDLNQLPLQTLCEWLAHAIEALLGLRTERVAQRPMRD